MRPTVGNCTNRTQKISLKSKFREHLTTDMRDKELSYWTCRGEETAGFFVAEVDGEIAGTVCYVIEDEGEMEMFRMSADKKFRGRGVGGQLLLKIEETARRLKMNKVKFNTSGAQEPAVALYTKRGYNLVRRIQHDQILIYRS